MLLLGYKAAVLTGYALRHTHRSHLRSTSIEEQGSCTSGVWPGSSASGETVSIYVDHNHPLPQLKRVLPWETLCEIITRHGRQAGKNTDGHSGLAWDVAL